LIKIKDKRNLSRRTKIIEEHNYLQSIPEKRFEAAVLLSVRVGPLSTIQVLSVTHSVPSRLIGTWLKAVVGRHTIQLMYGNKRVLELPRLEAGALINYRHIIDSLMRKPGAFEGYQYKEFLYPNVVFRQAFDALKGSQLTNANKRYLELLHVAKLYGEETVTEALTQLLGAGRLPLKADVLDLFTRQAKSQTVEVITPYLADYDDLHDFEEACA
jgi:hypothetical protein